MNNFSKYFSRVTICFSRDTICFSRDTICFSRDTICFSRVTICFSRDTICFFQNTKVQSTIIFVANFIWIRLGSAHRNLIIFRCAAPYELYFNSCYKYFAALPLTTSELNIPDEIRKGMFKKSPPSVF